VTADGSMRLWGKTRHIRLAALLREKAAVQNLLQR
jgi:hypothetical protein